MCLLVCDMINMANLRKLEDEELYVLVIID